MSVQRETIFDIDDPDKRGIYRDFDTTVKSKLGINVNNGAYRFKGRFVRRSNSDLRNWDDVNTEAATIEISLGEPDKSPTSGTWALAYNGDATGLDALAYNITAAALEAALNANAQVTAAGGVTVEEIGTGSYEIRFTTEGVKLLFTTTATNELRPEASVDIGRDIEGDAEHRETQLVVLARIPYAYTNDFTPNASGSVTMVVRQAGDQKKRNIQRLLFEDEVEPYDGNLIFNFDKPHVTNVICIANTAVKELTHITVSAGETPAGLGGKSLQIHGASDAARLVWFDLDNASVAPLTPPGGTLIEVDIATGNTVKQMASALQAAIEAHADFTATIQLIGAGTYLVKVTKAAYGVTTNSVDIDSGLAVATQANGTNGVLDLKTLFIYDEDGSVGIWFNASGATEVPAAAAAQDRQLEVALNPGDGGTAVATALKNIVDADGNFGAVVMPSTRGVTITDADGGEREDSEDVNSGCRVDNFQRGKSMTVNVPFDASEQDIESAFELYWEVKRTKSGTIDFRSKTLGIQPDIEVDAEDLSFPNINEAELWLNTARMKKRMAEDTTDPVVMTFQGMLTFAGEKPYCFLRERVPIYRSVLQGGAFEPGGATPWYFVGFPAAQNSPGTVGQMACDGNYFAFCYATDSWCYSPMSQAPFPPP